MCVPRRRDTSTAQSWRFVPDAILLGHRRAHWWVPAWTPTVHQCPQWEGRGWLDRTHEHMAPDGARNRHVSPIQTHEVTNTDSVIGAHGSGTCYGHTADDKIADRRSVLWRLHHRRLDVRLAVVVAACCKVPEHGLDDNEVARVSRNRDTANEELSTVTEYLTKLNDVCAVETELDDTRMQAFMSGKLRIKETMMLAMLTLSSESADPLRTTDDPLST